MESYWAELPNDLLIKISNLLGSIESYDSFGAVCRSWRAVTRDNQHLKLKTLGSPVLFMLPKKESLTQGLLDLIENRRDLLTDTREFLSFSSGRIRKIYIPEPSKNRYIACKDGWLLVVEEDEMHVSLFHLLSRIQIPLPPFPRPFLNFYRVCLSANPNSNSDFMVSVIWSCNVYLYKSGNTSWTVLDGMGFGILSSIIYHNDYLYAVSCTSRIFRCDVNGPNPTQWQTISDRLLKWDWNRNPDIRNAIYMVEISKKLFVVLRYIYIGGLSGSTTNKFEVYELKMGDYGWYKFVETKDLGNKAIFLGYDLSFAIEFSAISNYKPNCIYFSDYLYYNGDEDTGIYHLSDGIIEPLFDKNMDWGKPGKVERPLWIPLSF